jgi:alpha-tubulin suppressor-like RCC1 family protein
MVMGMVLATGTRKAMSTSDRLTMTISNPQAFAVTAISCGREHTLALLVNGKVIGWGGDGSGRIPSGVPEYCTTPAPTRSVEVIMREPMTSIAAGHGVSLGITTQRKVVIWGANAAGIGGRVGDVAPASYLVE